MVLRNSLSKTKKFFQKTLQSFKFLVSGGYQRLPKTHTFTTFSSCGCGGDHYLKNTHGSCRDHEDDDEMDVKTDNLEEPMKEEKVHNGSFVKFSDQTRSKSKREKRREDEKQREEVRELSHYYLVAKKLRELELMDMSDMEHVLDVEEVIHYYSRLTCPVYLEIFDKFFMQMYSEFYLLHKSR